MRTTLFFVLTALFVTCFFLPITFAQDARPVVSIPDANLATAVREALGLRENEAITDLAMRELTTLGAGNRHITDLTGLEHATNLTTLFLGWALVNGKWGNSNTLSNLSPISRLTKLEYLHLGDTAISDVAPLSELTNMESLYLKNTFVSDVSAFAKLTHLKTLDLAGTSVSDISVLSSLTNLESLFLARTPVSDISALSGLTNLKVLFFGSTSISDLSVLASLTNLERLSLPKNVSDVSALSGLTNLEYLFLGWTSVSDVSALSRLTNLESLDLRDTAVSDVSALSELTNLEHLFLNRTSVSDISALSGLANLKRLGLSHTSISDVSALATLTNLYYLHLGQTFVSDVSMLSELKHLEELILGGTSVSDIAVLTTLTKLETLGLHGTPLSYPSIHTHIPVMRARGAKVNFDGEAQPAFLRISGDQQENTAGLALANPIVVRAINATGKPMQNVTATFTITHRNETFNTTTAKTGMNGIAQMRTTLGQTPGKYTITVTAQQIPSFARFTAQATPTEVDPTDLSPIVQVGAAALPPMYWINTTSRKLYRTTAGSVKNIVPNVQNATSIAVDIAGHKVYWIEKTGERNGRIQRANFNGSNVELVKNLTSVPRDLAVDSAGRKLYLTNSWGKIQRLNLNGSGFQPDFIIDLTAPQHLALDVAGGKVYWTEPDSIWRANLNGKNKEKLIADLGEMGSIAVAGGKVYWTEKNKPDENRGTIRRAALDGSNVQTLATLLSVPIGITVDTVSRHLYLTNSNGRIQRANLAGKNIQNLVTELGMPAEIALGNTPNGAGLAAAPAAVPVFPDTTVLLANYPNPFNPETWIPYQLATPAEVTLTIYAANGAVVRTLHLGYQPAGTYDSRSRAVYWDGRNEIGERVASGVYFYTLSTADFMATRKMLIRK